MDRIDLDAAIADFAHALSAIPDEDRYYAIVELCERSILGDAGRRDLFEKLREHYCLDCGGDEKARHAAGGSSRGCQCRADEREFDD